MFKTIKHYGSTALFSAKLSIQRQLEYPSFLVSWIIGVPLQWIVGFWMLQVIISRFQALNGWAFNEVAFLYGISLLSHGLMVIFFIPTWNLDYFIIQGEFDRMLVRPMSIYFQFIVRYINFVGLMDFIPGLIIFIYACDLVGFNPSFLNILKVIIVVLGATLIRAGFYTVAGSLAFWTKRTGNITSGLSQQLMEKTTLYPLSIYPKTLQVFFTFVFPFGFIAFYPVSGFLGKTGSFELPLELTIWTPLLGIIYFYCSGLFFKWGLIRYESAGS